jgi:hypothetical protein
MFEPAAFLLETAAYDWPVKFRVPWEDLSVNRPLDRALACSTLKRCQRDYGFRPTLHCSGAGASLF